MTFSGRAVISSGQFHTCLAVSVAVEPSSTRSKFTSIRILRQFRSVRQCKVGRSINRTVPKWHVIP
ncbi:hypothetical protein PISMIDRAFT_374246 [Pisolithus microcarpus 441]|uniref:Uncharacterized protein n=1 Tax=Pisolithus microcarpus 441 TaxID=765257 RepID=A0A0C9YI79_9AGAM|nr:hypothetical protein PISMIDRAFT_374246 [Pisolithus microcarpus 441]